MQQKLEKEERDALIAAGQALKQQVAEKEVALKEVENALQFEAQRLPNVTHPEVPAGGEENATVLREVGTAPVFDFQVRAPTPCDAHFMIAWSLRKRLCGRAGRCA